MFRHRTKHLKYQVCLTTFLVVLGNSDFLHFRMEVNLVRKVLDNTYAPAIQTFDYFI